MDKIVLESEGHIIEKIQKGIRERNEERRHGKKIHYSPTDAAKCPRQLWYEFKEFPSQLTDEQLKIFAIGDITHEFLQEVLKTKGQLCSEFRVELEWHGFPVAGYVDSIIWDPEEGLSIVDFKTIKDNGMPYVEHKPKPEHVSQIHLYMDILKIKKSHLIYWSKSNGDMVQHEIKYDYDVINKIIKLFNLVQTHLDNNTLPKAKFNLKDWKCDYCKFKYYCQAEISEHPVNWTVMPEADN